MREYLQNEWNKGIRIPAAIGLVILTVDGFKSYHEIYGHLKGDDTLKTLADCMAACMMHSTDLVARFGGIAFVIILPDTTNAEEVAPRVVQRVAEFRIPHEKSVTDTPFVTINVGVGTFYAISDQNPTAYSDCSMPF